MKLLHATLALLIIVTAIGCSSQKNLSETFDNKNLWEQEVTNISKDKWRWMSEKKTDSLAALFHDKSMFVHMSGSWNKERELEIIKTGSIWYKQAEVYATSVNIIGSTAILLNEIDLVAVVRGNEVVNPFMVTEVYLKENGKWKMGSLTFSRLSRPVKIERKLTLEKIWESDSLTLNGPESVFYNSETNTLYVSSMNAGTVVQMDTSGNIIKKDWATGLNSNKGSAFYKVQFYTAETAAIAVIDATTGTVVKRIPVQDAVMLNDVVVDSKGIIYVTDTRAGKVYRIENDKPAVYLENLPGANGLLIVNNHLYVATATSFLKVDDHKNITTIADGFESGLDGIVMIAENEFIISNYRGILYQVTPTGTKHILLDTRANGIMSNDIGYNSGTKTLYVPSFSNNRVIAYKVQ